MKRPFRFAVQSFNADSGKVWAERVRRAEALGYSAFHLADHLLGPGPAIAKTNHPEQNARRHSGHGLCRGGEPRTSASAAGCSASTTTTPWCSSNRP
jgi:alkanesulfonate monooxygenase SsuD/methylene tetrahydromethanopterin reductase-like flavin-dependent oxidoreductase (luciferase family)